MPRGRPPAAPMPAFFVFAACAFASGFAVRLLDPIVLPVAGHFGVTPAAAALLITAYALPYAAAQLFLGPLGDRFGKARLIRACVAGLALMLAVGGLSTSWPMLVASRIAAGVFAGGLIPLVLAQIGDADDLGERQVMLGRMLIAIITGQLLGPIVSGATSDAYGWRAPLAIGALVALLATGAAWFALPASAIAAAPRRPGSLFAPYRDVLANPKAAWLIGTVGFEGALFFGVFPYVGELLLAKTPGATSIALAAGIVIGAFGVGGLLYATTVRLWLRALGVRRMCLLGSMLAAAAYAALAVVPLWWLAALAMLAAGFSFYMLHNSLQTEATELAPAARGSAFALFACGLFLGSGLGPIGFGALLHGVGPGPALGAVALALVVLGRVAVATVIDRRPA